MQVTRHGYFTYFNRKSKEKSQISTEIAEIAASGIIYTLRADKIDTRGSLGP